MKKQIALGLIAGAVALASTAFAPLEAQAKDNNKQQLNQLAMQMYMQNMARQQNLTAQQQFYGNQYGYNNLNNPYLNVNNPYLTNPLLNGNNNNPYLNQAYNGQFLAGNTNFNGNRGQCQGNRQFKRKFKRNNGVMNRARALLNGNGFNNGFNNNGFNNGFNNIGYNNGFLGNSLNGLNSQSGVGQLLNRFF